MTQKRIKISGTNQYLDADEVQTAAGVVQRQVSAIGDPTDPDERAAVSDGRLQVGISVGGLLADNCTTEPLAAGATYTGTAEYVLGMPAVIVALKTDQDGQLYVEFSNDGTNWDSNLPAKITAGTNEVHRWKVTRPWVRVQITNTSASPQTYLRSVAFTGADGLLTSALNSVIQADADAILTREVDFNFSTAQGLYQNLSNTIKTGMVSGIGMTASPSVPHDLSSIGGQYTGFPTSAQSAEIVVAGGDTGTVWYSYMASSSDTDYTFASKAVAGDGTYSLGHNIYRCNFAYFDSGAGGAANAGNITVQSVGGTYKFCRIDASYGESQCAAYTVPYASAIYLDMKRGNLRGSSSGALDGVWYYRESGKSPRLRWPFELQYGSLYFDEVDYLIRIPALTDICPRIVYSSANNQNARFNYRFVKVKE